MTVVVRGSAVVAQEAHRVAFGDVFGMRLGEVLHALPQRRDRLHVLVETQDEAVLLPVVAHVAEGVVVDVAEEIDARLHTPVPFELVHQRVAEKEAGFEAAHVSVADGVSVDDLPLRHVFPDRARLLLIDEVGEGPVFRRDLAVMGLSGDERSCDFLESLVEGLVVQEHPVIIVLPVESILDLADRVSYVP